MPKLSDELYLELSTKYAMRIFETRLPKKLASNIIVTHTIYIKARPKFTSCNEGLESLSNYLDKALIFMDVQYHNLPPFVGQACLLTIKPVPDTPGVSGYHFSCNDLVVRLTEAYEIEKDQHTWRFDFLKKNL